MTLVRLAMMIALLSMFLPSLSADDVPLISGDQNTPTESIKRCIRRKVSRCRSDALRKQWRCLTKQRGDGSCRQYHMLGFCIDWNPGPGPSSKSCIDQYYRDLDQCDSEATYFHYWYLCQFGF